jgi:formate C-acetyltransferase
MYNIATGIDGDAHFACDYRIGLALGFGGFLEKIEKYRAVNPGKDDFYDAEKRVVEAMIRFIDRHIEKIAELLPYHPLGEGKRLALGLPETHFTVPTKDYMKELQRYVFIR